MKIKFTRDAVYKSGPKDKWPHYKAGEVYDLEQDHAERWLRRDAAVIYDGAAKKAEAEEPKPAASHASIATKAR